MTKTPVTAAVCLIGDELLSGRTRDINVQQIAGYLAPLGIPVREVRIVPDEQDCIVEAVNALRSAYSYVFTTGGIGPTHDDITADAIAAAFGVGIGHHPEVFTDLQARYDKMGTEFTEARQRMARIPHGASLIENPVSGAPGFQTGNVFTLAGVPSIVQGMLQDVGHRLEHGEVVRSITVRSSGLREGDIAEQLSALNEELDGVSLGSYPWFRSVTDHGVALIARSTDQDKLKTAGERLVALVSEAGRESELLEGEAS
ncbi:competence/damage-inducible protein A [Henriciella aquimarina]|uniref:competence/damage-inducible protein A n=1 Tax=Henriciella aquimarina TaxID=545261 RepID=UPI0009FE5C69|nr:molybdopterin-binding protein [Henriciella aquimarina]